MLGGFRVDDLAQSIDVSPCAVLSVDGGLLDRMAVPSVIDSLLSLETTVGRFRLLDGSEMRSDGTRPRVPDHDDIVFNRGNDSPSRVRHGALADALMRGYTAVVNDAGPMLPVEFNRLCEQIGRVLATSPQVNVYVSEREAAGFGLHWDDHDVLIVQGMGRKRWEVFAPAALSPTKDRVGRTEHGERVLATVLEPGTALYIPRGWPHKVEGISGSLSAHFTVGLFRQRFTELIGSWASDRSSPGGLRAVDLDDPALALGEPWTAEEVEHQIGQWRRMYDPLPAGKTCEWIDLYGGEPPDVSLTVLLASGVVLVDHPDARETEVVIGASGRNIALDRSIVAGFSALLSKYETTFEEWSGLMPDRSPTAVLGLLRKLVALDVVAVAR